MKYSFRQIVAIFSSNENGYLLNLWSIGQIFWRKGKAIPGGFHLRELRPGFGRGISFEGPKVEK
jgi:hypothetical protein